MKGTYFVSGLQAIADKMVLEGLIDLLAALLEQNNQLRTKGTAQTNYVSNRSCWYRGSAEAMTRLKLVFDTVTLQACLGKAWLS